jgi:putative hemolysin
MLLPAVLLFLLFLALCAFFSSAETAFIASSPYTIEYLENKGSKRARLIRRVMARIDSLLSTILIGNTLVNAAAASMATSIFVSLIPNRNQAILVATLTTSALLLFFGEINPKVFAAHNPIRTAFLFIHPIRFLMVVLSPVVSIFSFLSRLMFPARRAGAEKPSRTLGEEEVRILLGSGICGLSALRRRMISGVLDIGSRPIKEVMVPRPQVKAIDIDSSLEDVARTVREAAFSRYPVYRGRMDNIEGLVHTKDIISYVFDKTNFNLKTMLRKPFFIPEFASMEKALLQMQERAVHMAFVVDEFGSVEGIVTLEDIIEEIVGDIQDEHDGLSEEWYTRPEEHVLLAKGSASIKEINRILPSKLPERGDYTTLAGFFLYEFGRIPQEKDSLDHDGLRFVVEKMVKRHIGLIRIEPCPGSEAPVA